MEPRNKLEEQLLQLTQEPPKRWYAGRAGRQRVVVLGALLLALLWADAGASYVLAPSGTAMVMTFVVYAVVLVSACVLSRALIVGTRGTVGLSERLLDERQRAERLRAYATAHRLTLLLLAVAYFAFPLAVGSRDLITELPSATVFLALVAMLVTVAALPTLAVAWRLPEPPDDEDDEA